MKHPLPGPLGKNGVVFNGGKPGTYTIYLDNLRIRHTDGTTTPLWTSGKDTKAGKVTAKPKWNVPPMAQSRRLV